MSNKSKAHTAVSQRLIDYKSDVNDDTIENVDPQNDGVETEKKKLSKNQQYDQRYAIKFAFEHIYGSPPKGC